MICLGSAVLLFRSAIAKSTAGTRFLVDVTHLLNTLNRMRSWYPASWDPTSQSPKDRDRPKLQNFWAFVGTCFAATGVGLLLKALSA